MAGAPGRGSAGSLLSRKSHSVEVRDPCDTAPDTRLPGPATEPDPVLNRLFAYLGSAPPSAVYALVGALVFLEDAVFVGFVVPGETAVLIGGVLASRGTVALPAVMAVVVAAAILGDTVGYEVGKHLGSRVLRSRLLANRRGRIDAAREQLRRRGGIAVLLGRFTAFFRAVMPALAGLSRMPYARFVRWNAIGGIVWGVGFTLIGYLAGNSYEAVAATVGRGSALALALVVVVGLIGWRVHRSRVERRTLEHPERAPSDVQA